MKRSKAIEFAKVIFSLFAAALCFASCSNFDEPVEGFLKSYGQIAKVMGVSYSRGTYSSPGWSNVDASEDFTLTYHINNPGNFPLIANLSVSGAPDLAAAGITLSVQSPYSIKVTYPASYLATVDMDTGGTGDISPMIYLSRATDNYGQSFDSRAIRCNAPPPFIGNALSQSFTDAATGVNEQIIVCFDLPDLPSDVNLLNVTDRRTGTVHSFSISGGVIATGPEANGWSIDTVPPGTLEETCPDGPLFSHYEGTAYYITTDVQNLKSIDIFDIELSLYDRGGLKSTRIVESRVQMLDPPTCNISPYSTVYNTYGQPYVEMIVTAPANAPDANLSFYITDENGDLVADVNGNTNDCQGSTSFHLYPKADGTMAQYFVGGISAYKQGWWGRSLPLGRIEVVGLKLDDPVADPAPASAPAFPQDTEVTFTSAQNGNLLWIGPSGGSPVSAPSPLKVTLENPGLNEFAVYAEKDYYQCSDTANFSYDVTLSKVYVQRGAPAGGTGTLADPVGSINDAITILNTTGDPTSPGNKICVLGDLPDMNGLVNISAGYYNIIGCGLDGTEGVVSSIVGVGGGMIFEVNGTGVVSLRAIKITGQDNASSGAVHVLGGTLILKDKVTIIGNTDAGGNAMNVNLAAGQVITVDAGGLEGTKVGVTTATAPSAGMSIPITSGYGDSASKNDPPSQHFASDLASCGAIFNSAKTDVVLATGGGGIDLGEIYSVSFQAGVAGGKATITAKASTSSSPTPVDITDDVDSWTVKLFYTNIYTGVSSSGTTAAGGNVLNLAGLGAGTYIAKVSAVYGGKSYSGEVEITKGPVGLGTPLTLEAAVAGAVVTFDNKASGPVTYKVNGGSEQTITSGATGTITLAAVGDKVQFYGDNAAYATDTSDCSHIVCSADCYVYGNIMSLVKSAGFASETTLTDAYTFCRLFENNAHIKNKTGYDLLLPATTLAEYCYVLMFSFCTSLTSAPELPATTLAEYCYESMFRGCTSLNSVTCLATDISASNCTHNWLNGVASSGTFTQAAGVDWSGKTGFDGIPSGWTVQNTP